METILKIAKESAEEANTYGKLTALYQILSDVQIRINEIEAKLPKDYWKSDAKQE